MSRTTWLRLTSIAVAALFALPTPGHAQIFKKLKETASQAAEDELLSQADQLVREGVACPFNDFECIKGAEEAGDDYYLTDESGEMIVGDDGGAVTDPYAAAEMIGEPPPPNDGSVPPPPPGAGSVPPADLSTANANYDFVAGENVLVFDDYTRDNVGDFPRGFELVEGSFEVIEWQGERYVRALSGGMLAIPLPETLPEQFTIEYAVNVPHGNAYARLVTGRAWFGKNRDYAGSAVSIEHGRGGIRSVGGVGPEALAGYGASNPGKTIVPVRVLADGEHMKVYVGDGRIANIPNAVFPRSDTLFLAVGSASPEKPIIIGSMRIAGGGRDLYDRLANEGRVATQGIYFDVNSATIRPESGTTLEEIGSMLQDHPELRISIEGHTDSDGDDASNLDLSERRAASVKDYLISDYGIDSSRLESVGLGETVPVADNSTPEGKQQNRRVELVRL
jgi:outer membrane protein OmpA-like peptidoglycan-associated protein